MTIAKTGSEVSYAGDGVSTAFSFPFRFFDDTDLEVYLVDSGSVSTLQTLTTDYSVTNTGTEDGGTVTMVVPPTSGNTLLIRRMIPATQSVDYQNNDAFPAETHEQAIDRLTLLSQQRDNENNLAIRFPTGDTASPVLPVVADRANRILTFDSDGEFLLEDNTLGIAATYNTRAEFVTAVAGGLAVANGGVIAAAGKFYLADSTSTDISDLPGFKVLGNFFSASQFPSNSEAYDFAEANGLMAETDEPNRFRGSKLTSGFNNTQNDAFVSYAVQVNSSNATRVRYKYVRGANSETAADPGTGKWATNLARTVLYFNDTDNDGDDRSKDLKNLKEGMRVKLTDTADTTASAIFILNADAVDNGTYVALPDVRVEERGAGGFPLEASVCNLTSEGTQKDIGFAVHINMDDPLASGDTTAGFFRAVSNVNGDQQNEGVRASAIGNYGSAVLRGPEADGTRITTGEVWGSYASAGFNQDNGVDLIGNSYDRANNATSGDPGSGNWGTRSDKTSLRISYTDGAGGDLTSALQAVGSGYKLSFRSKSNTSNRITWTIGAAGTDNGTYIQFDGLAAPNEAGNGTLIGDETEIIIYNGNTATDGKLVGIEIKAANWGGTVYDPLTASGENVGKYNIDFVAGADADNAFQQPVSAMMHNGNDTIGGWLYGGLFRNVRNDFMHFYQPLGSDVRALNLQKASSNLGSWAEEVIVLPDGTGIGWRDSAGTTISPVITRTGTTTSVADNLDAVRLYQNGVALELTRAEAVTYLGTTPTHTDGTKFCIDNLAYKWEAGSTAISDLPNLVPDGTLYVDHFKERVDQESTDMTSGFQDAIDYVTNFFDGLTSPAWPYGLQSIPINLLPGKYIVSDTLTNPNSRNFFQLQSPAEGNTTIEWRGTGAAKPFLDMGSGGANMKFRNLRTYVDPVSYTRPLTWIKTTGTIDHGFDVTGSYFWEAEDSIIECGDITNAYLDKFRFEGTNNTGIKITGSSNGMSANRLLRLSNWTVHSRTTGLTMNSLVEFNSLTGIADRLTVQFTGQRIELNDDAIDATNFDFVVLTGFANSNPILTMDFSDGGYQDNGTYAGTVSILNSTTSTNAGVTLNVRNFSFDSALDNIVRGNVIDLADWPAASVLAGNVSDFYYSTALAVSWGKGGLSLDGDSVAVGPVASPAKNLEVSGGSASVSTRFLSSATGSYIEFVDNTTTTPSPPSLGASGDDMVLRSQGATIQATINSTGVGVGATPSSAKLQVLQTAQSTRAATVQANNASFDQTALFLNVNRSASSDFDYMRAVANSAADLVFKLSGDGNGTCDGSWTGGGADYAEFFEWTDGNPLNEDRRGISVALEGDKIRQAREGDYVVGVISDNPSVVGDGDAEKWKHKYLRDDFGTYLTEDYDIVSWSDEDEHSYPVDQIPDGISVPNDAVRTTEKRRVLNPAFDPDVEYIPRSERPEWATVGMLGKLRVRNDQIVHPGWIKMRDISPNVSEWLIAPR